MSEEQVGNFVSDETEMDFSLADLAGLDTSDIAVVASRLPMAGVWTVQCKSAAMTMEKPKEAGQKPLPKITYKFESVKIDPLEKPDGFDPATTVGRKLSDVTVLWLSDLAENIGLLKGKYKRVGLPYEGKMGGVEGMEPGWIDSAVGSFMELKVRHAEIKGETRAFIDWVGPVTDDAAA